MGRVLGLLAGLALGLMSFAGAAQAQSFSADRWAVGVNAGTDGLGGELKYSLNRHFVFRLRGEALNFNHSVNSDGVHYSGKIKFGTGGAFVDWHPFANGFLLTGGVIAGQREVNLNGTPESATVVIDGHAYTAADVGEIYGRARLPDAAGFVGLGYDSTFVHRGPIGVSVIAGVQLGGRPDVKLTPTGLLATTPQLQGDVVTEEAKIRHDLDFTQTYPAISVGLSYRF